MVQKLKGYTVYPCMLNKLNALLIIISCLDSTCVMLPHCFYAFSYDISMRYYLILEEITNKYCQKQLFENIFHCGPSVRLLGWFFLHWRSSRPTHTHPLFLFIYCKYRLHHNDIKCKRYIYFKLSAVICTFWWFKAC